MIASVDLGSVRIGEFHCPPGDPMWTGVNWIGPEPHVVFPLVPVRIRQAGGDEFVTTPNHVVVYAGGDEYQRRSVGAIGDRCYFLALSPELADRLGGPRAARGLADLSPELFLQQRRLVARIRSGAADLLDLEERAIELTSAALGSRRRPETWDSSPHLRALAERAKELLAVEYAGDHRLSELAALLHVSPYHLARSFRAATGWSLHGYRTSLRLRAVLDSLADPAVDLAALARATGFANHSHLTATFRQEFGVTPSAARAALAA